MSGLKKIAQNTTYYTISTILLRASSIIFFPIFSLYLTKSDYGTFSVVQSIILLAGLIGGLGLNRALTRFIYYNAQKNTNDHDSIIFTTLISNICGQVLFSTIIILIGPYILKPILKDIPFYPYVLIGLITIPLNSFIDTARQYFKAIHEGRKTFILDISFYSFNIIFNLIFVVIFKYGVLGLFIGVLINTFIFSLILFFLFYLKFSFRIRFDVWKQMITYSLPLLPFIILNVVFESIDKFFLNANNGAADSGIYYLALTFAAIFSSFKEAVISALTPWVFENIKTSIKQITRVFNIILLITGVLGFLISLFSKEVLIILSSNPEFIDASKYIPFAVISFYIIFLGQLFNIKTLYFGNYHKYLFLATALGIISEIIACYLLIPSHGLIGAILSRIIAFSMQTILFVYYSKKETEYKNMYNYKFLFTCILFMSCLISTPFFIDLNFTFLINLTIKIGILIFVIILIYLSFKKELKSNLYLITEIFPFLKKYIKQKEK